jgi:hypothetical protein
LLPIGRHWHVTLPHLQFQCLIKSRLRNKPLQKYHTIIP